MTEQILRNILFAIGAIFLGIMYITMIIAFIRGIVDDSINSEMERRKNGPCPKKRVPRKPSLSATLSDTPTAIHPKIFGIAAISSTNSIQKNRPIHFTGSVCFDSINSSHE